MKKILVLALGLGVVLGTVSFAQDTTGTDKKMERKRRKRRPTTQTRSSFSGQIIPEKSWVVCPRSSFTPPASPPFIKLFCLYGLHLFDSPRG